MSSFLSKLKLGWRLHRAYEKGFRSQKYGSTSWWVVAAGVCTLAGRIFAWVASGEPIDWSVVATEVGAIGAVVMALIRMRVAVGRNGNGS